MWVGSWVGRARSIHRLSARTVASLTDTGYHADGGGLYLQISPTGTKSWIFRFTIDGRAREMGLGSLLSVSLATARTKAQECRALLQDGVDPIEARQAHRAASRVAASRRYPSAPARLPISRLTGLAGAMPSTPTSGGTHSKRMPNRSWVTCWCRASTPH